MGPGETSCHSTSESLQTFSMSLVVISRQTLTELFNQPFADWTRFTHIYAATKHFAADRKQPLTSHLVWLSDYVGVDVRVKFGDSKSIRS